MLLGLDEGVVEILPIRMPCRRLDRKECVSISKYIYTCLSYLIFPRRNSGIYRKLKIAKLTRGKLLGLVNLSIENPQILELVRSRLRSRDVSVTVNRRPSRLYIFHRLLQWPSSRLLYPLSLRFCKLKIP